VADRFVKFDGAVAGGQRPVADPDRTKILTGGTRLWFAKQLRLSQRKILRDVAGDGSPEFPGRSLDAGKGSIFSGDPLIVQIHAEFLREVFYGTLIFVCP
jgi:hypothetical protein